jgi:uncharacterized protein
MATFVMSFLILAVVMTGMAVGVLFGRKPIKGTCGGLNSTEGQTSCQLCGGDPVKCEELPKT